jgi:hypothetical protein
MGLTSEASWQNDDQAGNQKGSAIKIAGGVKILHIPY